MNCTQQCFAIKGGVDGFLDLARTSFSRTTEVSVSEVRTANCKVKDSPCSLARSYVSCFNWHEHAAK